MSDRLESYRRKRDFRKTAEPAPAERPRRKQPKAGRGKPAAQAGGALRFVVHRHEARRLHYDLRLEAEGVLLSWAVPKGFSYDPADKRLAVHTEDHPLEYEHFEGVIPKGEYGAGTMTIWDHGVYRSLKLSAPVEAVRRGELKLLMRGRRLRGEWHLVRMRRQDSREDQWLLFKARDRYARTGGESELVPQVDLSRAPEAPFPEGLKAMLPRKGTRPFSDPGWLFEAAFSGRRLLAEKQGDEVRFRGPDGKPVEAQAGRVIEELARLRAENAVLDGTLVALDPGGRPSLEALRADAGERLFYYACDLLYMEDWDLRSLPLLDRKAALSAILPRAADASSRPGLHGGPGASGAVQYLDHVRADGETLAATVAAAGLETVWARKADAPYRAGSSSDWREIRVSPKAANLKLSFAEALAGSAPGRGGARGGLKGRLGAANLRGIKLTHLDKVFWPGEGYTKAELIGYYDQVAELLLPHLAERPVHMLRYPDGINGKSFYQRQAPEYLPEWIETIPIQDEEEGGPPVPHIICNHRAALLYVINLGSIDLHPWLSRRGSLESPDWAVLDLDAKEAPFPNVVRLAREAGKLLRGLGLRPCLKTSGASGMHIYIPLKPGYTYDQSRLFCEAIARMLAAENREIASAERAPGARQGKVYLDFLQNRKSATVVPPYAVRPLPGAPVSMPLDWDELDLDLVPGRFTIATAPRRLAASGDLFRAVLSDRQDLGEAIGRIEGMVRQRRR
jgi:bifunctional non-homologous end joining protein LigD